jgi:hypothetical protein
MISIDDLGYKHEDFNDRISSMIIFSKKMWVSGVFLIGHHGSMMSSPIKMWAFYPLPESLNESEARYPTLGWMNDEAIKVTLYNDVEVTLYEHANFAGKPLKMPGADFRPLVIGELYGFELQKYQFDRRASSLVVRARGPQQQVIQGQVKLPPAPPPRDGSGSGKTHRAPPAPSSGHSIYDLARTFESGTSSSFQQGSPSGMDTTPMGTTPMGTTPGTTGVLPQQKSTGTTSAFGDIRKSTSTPSSRGVKSKPGYPQTGDRKLLPDDPGDRQTITAAQPAVARSGDSQVQQGRVSLPESGQIPARTSPPPAVRAKKPTPVLPSGREEELIRTREMQQGKTRPPERVTTRQTQAIRETPPKRREEVAAPVKPPSDRQERREPAVPGQREMVAKIAAPDIAGRWGSSIGSVYEITQQGNRFAWSVTSIREKGDGTIEGNKLSARWSGQNGSGSAEGKITQIDGRGKATRIEWSNGLVFYRGKAPLQKIEQPDTRAIPIHIPSTGDSREKEPRR